MSNKYLEKLFIDIKFKDRHKALEIIENVSDKSIFSTPLLEYKNATALIYACDKNMSDVALALIATGQSNPAHHDNKGNTALIWACYNNMSKVALALIATGQSNPMQIDECGATALIRTCENNMTDVAMALIATGQSNPAQTTNKGNTALIRACQNKMTDVALALIATGQSNLMQKNNDGYSALMVATENNMQNVVHRLTYIYDKIEEKIKSINVYDPITDPYEENTLTTTDFLYKNELESKKPFIVKNFDRYIGNYLKLTKLFHECVPSETRASRIIQPERPLEDGRKFIKLIGRGGATILCLRPSWFNSENIPEPKIFEAVKVGVVEQIISDDIAYRGANRVSGDHCNLTAPVDVYELISVNENTFAENSASAIGGKRKQTKKRRNKKQKKQSKYRK